MFRQFIYNKSERKVWVVFILYGRELTEHKAFWYLYLKEKDHLGQLDVNDRLRFRRFRVRTPVAATFFSPV
jgi:hypothetical protein